MALVNIDPKGDVILVVGGNKTRVRVDARTMGKGSLVFKTMFFRNFAEGKDHSRTKPKEVSLQDDSPDALILICNIFHLQPEAIPQSLCPQTLLDLVIMADKYDCGSVLRDHFHRWLAAMAVSYKDDFRMTAAAYLLGDKFWSRFYIKCFVYEQSSSIELLQLSPLIPIDIYIQIEKQRQSSMELLITALGQFSRCKGCNIPFCRYSYNNLVAFQFHLQAEITKLSHGGIAALPLRDTCDILLRLSEDAWIPRGSVLCTDGCHEALEHSFPRANELRRIVGLVQREARAVPEIYVPDACVGTVDQDYEEDHDEHDV